MITNSNPNKIYITYLEYNNVFNSDLIETNLESIYPTFKPKRAFWGSPSDAKFGWKEWCEREDFGNYNFNNPIKWKLKDDARIFNIDMNAVLNPNTIIKKYVLTNFYGLSLDFKHMKNDDIDAIELLDAKVGHEFYNELESGFYGWDCESIVVLNPSKIIFLNQY